MKELSENFIGKGQVKGFVFTQKLKTDNAYIYEVNTGQTIHYEVFKRKVNNKFNCISYPSDKSFGIWAWTCLSYEKAIEKLEHIKTLK